MAGSNYIRFPYPSGAAADGLYALVYKPDMSQIYNTNTALFETLSAGNYSQYAVELTEYSTLASDSIYYAVSVGAMDDAVTYPCLICAYPASGVATSGDTCVGNGTMGPDLGSASFDGKTGVELLRILAAVVAGKITTAGTGSEVFKGLDGSTTRATVTVDSNGNRSAVTYG